MAETETVEFERIPVGGSRLPVLLKPVLVETLHGTNYVAARFEVKSNMYAWGLVFNKRIVGKVESVAYWFERV